jgi:hypothetical protein
MPLTQEQQTKLLESYRQGKASGQTKEQSIASIKDYLIKSGQYDSAKTAYNTPIPANPNEAITSSTEQPVPVAPFPVPSQAPAPAPAPLPAPVAPRGQDPKTPGTPVTPVPTATSVTPQRTQEIQQNLMDGSTNAKQNFADVDTFKRAYGYDQKPEAERAILDKFWSSYAEKNATNPVTPAPVAPTIKPTKNESVIAIWNGQETPEMKADPSYPSIKAASDKARKYSGMSTDELTGAIAGSQITEEQASLISKLDPAFSQKWEAAKAQYKLKIDTGVANETASSFANSALGEDVGEDGITPEKYEDPIIKAISAQINALTSATAKTQAEKDAQSTVNDKKAKIDELTQSRDKIYEDLSKSYAGVPKSLLMAMAAEKAKPINEQISTLTREANLALGQYNAAVEERQLAGDTAKTVASLNLEVAKRYADVQDARAKALQDSMTAQKRDTKVETLNINGKPTKVLIDMQTGNPIADLGPDISSSKYQLTDYMGMKMAYDPSTGTMKPVQTDIAGNPEQEQKLNKDYASDTVVKGFDITKQAYGRVMQTIEDSLAGRGNGIKDIAVMYDFIKGLDPTSVVRESEVALMNQANSIWGRLTTNLANMKEGRVLNDTILKQVADQMQTFYDIAKAEVAKKQAGYIRRAGDVKARVDRVIDGDIYAPYNANSFDSYLGKPDESILDSYLQ